MVLSLAINSWENNETKRLDSVFSNQLFLFHRQIMILFDYFFLVI